jgi:UDP:flavonoid glycosyltransferase YjiC (YdhE family)
MSDSSYGESARRLQQAIQKTDGLSRAADIIEAALAKAAAKTGTSKAG